MQCDARAALRLLAVLAVLVAFNHSSPALGITDSPAVREGEGTSELELPAIVVHADGTVSLNGRSPSLHTVIEKLCAATGIQLRGYEAADRRMRGRYDRVSLSDLLERLLREESFVVGFSSRADTARRRVRWLRVLDRADRSDSKRAAAASLGALIPGTAYQGTSPSSRRRATIRFVETLDRQPQIARRLAGMRDQAIVDLLERADHGAEFATTLAQMVHDRALRAKFSRIATRLARR